MFWSCTSQWFDLALLIKHLKAWSDDHLHQCPGDTIWFDCYDLIMQIHPCLCITLHIVDTFVLQVLRWLYYFKAVILLL